jgi:hypothetical protein
LDWTGSGSKLRCLVGLGRRLGWTSRWTTVHRLDRVGIFGQIGFDGVGLWADRVGFGWTRSESGLDLIGLGRSLPTVGDDCGSENRDARTNGGRALVLTEDGRRGV